MLEAGVGAYVEVGGIWAASRSELLCQLSTFFYQFIPMPVLYGIFLYMGVAAISSIQVSPLYSPCNPTPPLLSCCYLLPILAKSSPILFS